MLNRLAVGVELVDVDAGDPGVFRIIVKEIQKVDVRPYIVASSNNAVDDDADPRAFSRDLAEEFAQGNRAVCDQRVVLDVCGTDEFGRSFFRLFLIDHQIIEGKHVVSLRPPGIWGPGDVFSRELPRAIRSGQFAFIERGNYPFVALHVDNLVEAVGCVLAAETGGRAYFVNDTETVTFREFVNGLAKLQGLSTDKLRSMPYGLAFFLGRIMEMGAAIIRSDRDPPLSRTLVRLIGREFTTDDSAARHELGYVGRVSRAEGLAKYPA